MERRHLALFEVSPALNNLGGRGLGENARFGATWSELPQRSFVAVVTATVADDDYVRLGDVFR